VTDARAPRPRHGIRGIGPILARWLTGAAFVLTVSIGLSPLQSVAIEARVPQSDAVIIFPQGMPLRLEDGEFYGDGSVMTVIVRNGAFEPMRLSIRIVVFDDRRRLRGSVGYCVGPILQPGTRQPLQFPLEVKGAVPQDRFVAVLETVRSARKVWSVRGGLPAIIEQARHAADLRPAELVSEEQLVTDRPIDKMDIPPCACGCQTASALGDEGCHPAPLAAFTCSPTYPENCSMGFTCKSP